MSKVEILEELPRLKPEERREVLEKIRELDHLAGDEWLDTTDLTDADKVLLETRLAAYAKDPDTGSSWEEVEARICARLKA
jgi:putative addiction module component (TIGR02574 family)